MKVEVYVETDKVRSRSTKIIEIPDEDLEGYEGAERDEVIEEYAKDALFSMIDWGWLE